MKKRLFLLLICTILFVFTALTTKAAATDTQSSREKGNGNYTEEEYERIYSSREHIKNMIVNMQINKDGTITVNEEIDYFFPAGYKHGVYRYIPVLYPGGTKGNIAVKMNYTTRNGKQEKYKTEYKSETVNFKIGDAGRYVSGMNKYVLNYTVFGAVTRKDKDRYEIDWNAVGQGWSCDILDSEVNIFFEDREKVFSNGTKLEIYTGTFNEKGEDYHYITESDIIKISTTKILESNNGLSFFLNFETDKIHPDILKTIESFMYKDELLFFSGVFLISFLVFMLLRILTLGKNPQVDKETYGEVPNELSPMFMAYLKNDKKIENIISVGVFTLISKKHMEMHPEISDDAFELLDSAKNLTEEERALKSTLEKQKFGQRDIEAIVEDKISNLLKESDLNLDEERLDKLKKVLENEGKSRKINKFSNITEDSFYAFQDKLKKMLVDKKMQMIVKDNFGFVFAIVITGIIVFGGYKIGYMITKDVGGGIAVGVNIVIWLMIGLVFYVLGNPSERSWIWGVTIGILFFISTQNFLILIIWCIFGYSYNKYLNLTTRYTEYGARVNYEIKIMADAINTYKSDVKEIFSTEEMTKYIDKMYPYMAAIDMTYGMEKLMGIISENCYVSHDEINNNFRNTYRHNTIKNYVSRSYNSAVNSHASSSDSGSSHSSSGGHSSGGGHGGGGGGSW